MKIMIVILHHQMIVAHQKRNKEIKQFIFISLMCLFFMTIEIIGGYIPHSIAIMSDAAHLLNDLLGFKFQ